MTPEVSRVKNISHRARHLLRRMQRRLRHLKERVRETPFIGTAMIIQKRHGEHAAGQFAAAIAYFGFVSLFPLLLIGLAIAGFLLDDPQLQSRLTTAMTRAVPGIRAALGENLSALVRDRAAIGVLGFVGLILSGLRVVGSAKVATTRVFELEDEANLVEQKLRSLAALVWLGALAVLGGAAAALAGLDLTGPLQFLMGIGGTALSLLVDTLLFLSAYRLLAAGKGPPWRDLWPGALASGTAWTLLKVAGSALLARQVASARPVYGSLASVIAVLLYFYLVAQLYIYGAEFNALRVERNQQGMAT